MKKRNSRLPLLNLLRCIMSGAALVLLCGFAGYTEVTCQSASPEKTYEVKVTLDAGPSERYSQWRMDVSREGIPFLSDYAIRPFYAWTGVNNGKARWLSDSVLRFSSYGAGQGRAVAVSVRNTTDKAVPFTEVWIRSVDKQGYSHCPGLYLIFDIQAGSSRMIRPGPMVFAGGEYFLVGCEQDRGKSIISHFKVPQPVSSRAPYLSFRKQRIDINLTPDGPVIEATGGLEALTEQAAKTLVPKEVFLPLVEERREHESGKPNVYR